MGVTKKIKSQGIGSKKRPRSKQSGGKTSALQGQKQNSAHSAKNTSAGTNSTDADRDRPDLKQLIWQIVAMIPKGKVASYGQIASLTGFPKHSRYVGSTLRNLPKGSKLPWYRVVNSTLRISQRGGGEARQRRLLEAEGITFIGDRITKNHRWDTD